MACESFHSHGRKHQVDLERRRGHRRGVVALECFWLVPLPLANPRWVTSKQPDSASDKLKASTGLLRCPI